MTRRSPLVYGLLLAAWLSLLGWQAVEHTRVEQSARTALVNRGRDITSTVSIVIRAQRRFSVVSKERLEAALKDLIRPGELNAIVLLNAAGEEVVSAGTPVDLRAQGKIRAGVHWESERLLLANLVDLGTNYVTSSGEPAPTIVLPRRDFPGGDTNRPAPGASATTNATNSATFPPPRGFEGHPPTNTAGATNDANRVRGSGEGFRGRSPFGRPPWMSEEEYKTVTQKQGLHSFLIVMSTQGLLAISQQDAWLRGIIGVLATIAALGSGLAWRNLVKSSELQLRLVRASQQNTHLKEMSLAAAGLAHETRNPLNIIRGLAQMISKEAGVSGETREKSRAILEESDRVTAQLNEFINYSRPREVRRSAVALRELVSEVARALTYDVEEKKVRLQLFEEPITIEADEQLLRQALFNLLLNATQAVAVGGEITVAVQRRNDTIALEVRDNGPGVPADQRAEVFKPYFTTNQKGMGLGLAVVQQIVAAHSWDIQCVANEPQGAVFRIDHLKLVPKA